ncbi:hypothetical protein OU426_05170 [Frigidibacter sp. RF13]|uniref:hypothetical protein n=1 Tax=Frigidibacter sp. RF13 TaxID=2997340 RepID=UPI00226EDC24|nr:hypothetical protein [Frigidibacter sp. RF13]MCY1126239.1 hypothetical protein [Frigidibacter sp. RF13]
MSGNRRSSHQVLAEFHWLYDCLEAFVAAQLPLLPEEVRALYRKKFVTRERMLALVAEGKATPSMLVTGAKSGLSDCREQIRHMRQDNPRAAEALQESYVAARGRPFEKDVALAREAAA